MLFTDLRCIKGKERIEKMNINVEYTCSPRCRAAVGYCHDNITDYWADTEVFSGDRADEIIAAIKSGEIWSDIDLSEDPEDTEEWEILKTEEEADLRGDMTLFVSAYDADAEDYDPEPIARTSRVIAIHKKSEDE